MLQKLSELSPIVAYDGHFIFSGANSGLDSDILDVHGHTLHGIKIPSGFAGASVTLMRCDTADGTPEPIYDVNGNIVTLSVVASRYRKIDVANVWGERFIALRAATAQTNGTEVKAACAGY